MFITQFVIGLVLAASLVGAAFYLAFVYPYAEGFSLKGLWWGLGTGAVGGLAAITYVLYRAASDWPGD